MEKFWRRAVRSQSSVKMERFVGKWYSEETERFRREARSQR